MKILVKLLIPMALVALGYGWGTAHAATPETKVVRVQVPKIIETTKVVTETKTVTKPLPDSCVEAAKIINDLNEPTGIISRGLGDAKLAADQVTGNSVTRDYAQMNDGITKLNAAKDKINAAGADLVTGDRQLQYWITTCNSDVARG